VAVIAVLGVLMAVTVPSMMASLDMMRLGQATRDLAMCISRSTSRAVSKGRAIRVRFNCPGPGEYRITELIGTVTVPAAADDAANRCDPVFYPFPVVDNDPLTLPNLDGPVRRLPDGISFSVSETIEFWPNGTAHHQDGVVGTVWPLLPTAGAPISLAREGKTSTITVNGLGKILIEQQ
jgi:Tfp pilus assembly protein FimT